jgi:hypothetical protein
MRPEAGTWSSATGLAIMREQTTRRMGKSERDAVSLSGVDLTLIRKYLAMSPTERLRAWYGAARLALELRKHAPRPPEHP